MSQTIIKEFKDIINSLESLKKRAFTPPMDPAAAGGMPPGGDPAMMDPAMAGGMPPVDPATGMPMDPAMMDPAMAGGMPPPPPGGGGEMEGAIMEIMQVIEQMTQGLEQMQQEIDTMKSEYSNIIASSSQLEGKVDLLLQILNKPNGIG